MSDFRTLKGLYIKHVSSDPANLVAGDIWYNTTTQTLKTAPQLGTWAAGGNLNTARYTLAGTGTQTAALAVGGRDSPIMDHVEEYDGSSWTEVADYPGALSDMDACGPQTAALVGCGQNPGSPPGPQVSFEYNGSSFANPAPYGRAAVYSRFLGTQTAALLTGGQDFPNPVHLADSEEYDGSSWTAGGSMGTVRGLHIAAGTQTAGLVAGGRGSPGNETQRAEVEEYDGSSWTEVNNLPAATKEVCGGGIQTAAIYAGGHNGTAIVATSFTYDGTNWTAGSSMANVAYLDAPAKMGNTSAYMQFGGSTGTTTNTTEEFTQVVTARSVDTT